MIVIFVLVVVGLIGFGGYKAWSLTQRWGMRPEQVRERRRRKRLKRGEVEPDAGAYSAWKAADYVEAEQRWMEAWVSLLSEEDKRYITDFLWKQHYEGSSWYTKERVEAEIHKRLMHWERRRIENRTTHMKRTNRPKEHNDQ